MKNTNRRRHQMRKTSQKIFQRRRQFLNFDLVQMAKANYPAAFAAFFSALRRLKNSEIIPPHSSANTPPLISS